MEKIFITPKVITMARTKKTAREELGGSPDGQNFSSLTVVELKKRLKAEGLSVTGTKDVLIERISLPEKQKKAIRQETEAKAPAKSKSKAPAKKKVVKAPTQKAPKQKVSESDSEKPSKGYKWQWEMNKVIDYPQLALLVVFPTVPDPRGNWVDFPKWLSDYLEDKWKDDPKHSDLLLLSSVVDFKTMTVTWHLNIPPLGIAVEMKDLIRRVRI